MDNSRSGNLPSSINAQVYLHTTMSSGRLQMIGTSYYLPHSGQYLGRKTCTPTNVPPRWGR